MITEVGLYKGTRNKDIEIGCSKVTNGISRDQEVLEVGYMISLRSVQCSYLLAI